MITVTQVQQDMMAIEKRRRKDREEQAARAAQEREEPPLTPAHIAARAELAEAAAEHAQAVGKAFEDRGAVAGPGQGADPGTITPEDFRRGYLEQGHASRSPQAEAPRTPPMPPAGRGIITPVEVSAAPVVSGTGPAVAGILAHQARSGATAGRPPVPRGSA